MPKKEKTSEVIDEEAQKDEGVPKNLFEDAAKGETDEKTEEKAEKEEKKETEAKEEEKKEEKAEEKEEEVKEDATDEGEKKAEGKSKPDEKPEKEEEKKKTATEIAEERGKELEADVKAAIDKEDEDKEEEEAEEKPKAKKKAEKAEKPKKKADKGILEDVDLTEEEDQFLEEFPEATGIFKKMAEKLLGDREEGEEDELPSTVEELKQDVKKLRDQILYNAIVGEVHPDMFKISNSKEYNEWIDGQTKMFKLMHMSPDPQDGIKLLSYYKEDIAKKKLAEKDKAAEEKKTKVTDLHKKGPEGTKGEKEKTDESSFEDAFGEAAKEKDKEKKAL